MSMSDPVRVEPIGGVVRSDMLARLMERTIIGGRARGVVRLQTLVVRRSVSLVSFASCVDLAESLFAPGRQADQTGHVKRSHTRGDESHEPEDLAAAEDVRRKSLPQDFSFGEE